MSDLVGNPEDRFSHVTAHISLYMSCFMRKPNFKLWESKDAVTAQLICTFVFAARIVQFFSFKLLAFLCDCTDWFVSDLIRNPEEWFSRIAAAHICSLETKINIKSTISINCNSLKIRIKRRPFKSQKL